MEKINLNKFSIVEDEPYVAEFHSGKEVIKVEVIKSLPLETKVNIIQTIVNQYVVAEEYYFNPLKLRTLAEIKTIQASTNIEIEESEIESNIYDLHDKLKKTGILDLLVHTDYNEIVNWAYECAEVLCKFRSSFRGFLEEVKDSNKIIDMNNHLVDIAETFKDTPEIRELLQLVANNVAN